MPRLVLIALVTALIFIAGCITNIPFISGGPPSFMTKCTTDTDCVAVCPSKNCCCDCPDLIGINKKYVAEWNYANTKYCQSKNITQCPAKEPCSYTTLCISGKCMINQTAAMQ
ncbi:MAG: hypothetical protein KQA33_02255 [Candidatus Aenigmarchaeota archaeon]|nr:hypothetical protein [Candidatus Aenigmarchaeota archaeon]